MSFELHVKGVPDTVGARKCLAAAAAAGKHTLSLVPADEGRLPLAITPALRAPDGGFIFGANAVARFLASHSKALKASDLSVDGWLWVEQRLEAALAEKDAAAVAAGLVQIEGAAARGFLVGSALTLADLVVVPTVGAALSTVAADKYPATRAYVEKHAASPAFTAAVDGTAAIKECGAPELDEAALSGSVLDLVYKLFKVSLDDQFPSASSAVTKGMVIVNTAPSRPHHYQCNMAMSSFKVLKSAGQDVASPRAVAEALITGLPRNAVISRCEVAGPGFINVFLAPSFLSARLEHLLREGVKPPQVEPVRVAIDYSSPNIAKEMHVGHLRSTIIGDTIARILEFCGHTLLRINHVGDWGTQFGMLIAHLKDAYPDFESNPPDIADLTAFYKAAKVRFDKEEDFKGRAHAEVVALQAGDEVNVRLWKLICAISERMFKDVYSRLNIDGRLEVCGESFYNPMLPSVVEELEKAGLAEKSDGATILKVEGEDVPLMVRKSDGGYGYDSTDLAAIRYRIQELKCKWLIYVVDAGQSLHFDLVFKGAQKAGWYTPETCRVDHVGFGVVQSKDEETGKITKFKTRSGETVRLVDVLDEAKARAGSAIRERLEAGAAEGKSKSNIGEADVEHASEVLGYGSVKYFDLRRDRNSNYVFEYDDMLTQEGNTAVYMNYAHARVASIFRKASSMGADAGGAGGAGGADGAGGSADVEAAAVSELLSRTGITLGHPTELALAVHVARFSEVIEGILGDLRPHRLCSFLYELSVKFNDFYRDCHVTGTEEQDSRLLLLAAVARTMRAGLGLLGIDVLDQM